MGMINPTPRTETTMKISFGRSTRTGNVSETPIRLGGRKVATIEVDYDYHDPDWVEYTVRVESFCGIPAWLADLNGAGYDSLAEAKTDLRWEAETYG